MRASGRRRIPSKIGSQCIKYGWKMNGIILKEFEDRSQTFDFVNNIRKRRNSIMYMFDLILNFQSQFWKYFVFLSISTRLHYIDSWGKIV